MRLSPILGLVIIGMRGFHGIDFGFFVGLGFYSCFSFILWFISPWFLKLTPRFRILFSMGVTLPISIGISINLIGNDALNNALDLWVAYLAVPPLGVLMFAYVIEMIDQNNSFQQQLIKSEKLEAVEQMGAAISHELRNPLTTAIGFVGLLEKDPRDSEKRTHYLAILKDELESAEKIIQNYLIFSKPSIESVDKLKVQDEISHLLQLLQPLANYHSVKISTNFSSNGVIEGNREKFQQCLINIIKNSIESMPNGGELVIKTLSTKKKIIITIQDTGMGMNEGQLKRLGEPYYTTKGAKGTGLGLTISYTIIRTMKGSINVQSVIEKGTVFTISFKHSTSQ